MDTELLDDAVEQSSEQVEAISSIPLEQTEATDAAEEVPLSAAWEQMRREQKFQSYTNFSEDVVLDLLRDVEQHVPRFRKRGPRPKISTTDAFLMALVFYSTAQDFSKIADIFKVKEAAARKAIDRTRGVLFETLTDRWTKNRIRPTPLSTTNFPYIALLCDTTSIEVFRPTARFEEAKRYWDSKNHIYAIKKEVAVLANSPHYALFLHKGEVASRHDYSIFKDNYAFYLDYLSKTTEERARIPTDRGAPNWAMLLDRGYIGPDTDTPTLRKLTPKKVPRSTAERAANKELDSIRAPVEMFFGRLNRLWAVVRNTYRWDHATFDVDFDICCLLTNEHIKANALEEIDGQFYLQRVVERQQIQEAARKKRQQQQQEYQERKRRRVV